MKFTILSLLLGLCTVASALDLGQEVHVAVNNDGPQISVVYAVDQPTFNISFSLTSSQLLPPLHEIKSLFWRLYDSSKGQFLTPWTAEDVAGVWPGMMGFTFGVSAADQVLAAKSALPHLKLVFAVDQPLATAQPTHYIDVGALCSTRPDHFLNLTTAQTGCGN